MRLYPLLLAILFSLVLLLCILDYTEVVDIQGELIDSRVYSILPFAGPNYTAFNNGLLTIREESKTWGTPPCVPFYETLDRKAKKLKLTNYLPPLVPLAAYDFGSHATVTIQNDGYAGQEMFCHFYAENGSRIAMTRGYTYPEFVVSCCRREGASSVGITKGQNDVVLGKVPLMDRRNRTAQYDLSVCLCPIYGTTPSWLLLAELIEHYKLQGVDHFYVYVKDIDSYSRKLLESYTSTGEVEAVYLAGDKVRRKDDDWQIVGTSDCVIRSRYHSKYVISQDLDERITPTNGGNLRDFTLNYFELHRSAGLISFRCRWILRGKHPPDTYEGEATLREHLPTLVYHNTSVPAPEGHTAKTILNPLAVLSMWVHDAVAFYPGYRTEYISKDQFVVRHYRDVVISDWGTRWMPETLGFGEYTLTGYPGNWLKILFDNVKRRLDSVYL